MYKKNTWPVTPAGRVYQVMLPTSDNGALEAHYVDAAVTTCSCRLGSRCPAMHEVRGYLAAGGTKTNELTTNTTDEKQEQGRTNSRVPVSCPICGAATRLEYFGVRKGWRCEEGGLAHYYQARYGYLKDWLTRPAGSRLLVLATAQERAALALYYPAGA